MTELETLSLGQRFPELEAFTTSGGISTLAESLVGRIANADYKTIRYPGHARIISTMMSLGFFSDQVVAQSGETAFDVSAGILEKSLYSDAPDVVLVKAEVKQGSDPRHGRYYRCRQRTGPQCRRAPVQARP